MGPLAHKPTSSPPWCSLFSKTKAGCLNFMSFIASSSRSVKAQLVAEPPPSPSTELLLMLFRPPGPLGPAQGRIVLAPMPLAYTKMDSWTPSAVVKPVVPRMSAPDTKELLLGLLWCHLLLYFTSLWIASHCKCMRMISSNDNQSVFCQSLLSYKRK